jgi:hypothetical protein
MTVERTASKPRGLISTDGEMKFAAALLIRPVSGPPCQIRSTHGVDLCRVAHVADLVGDPAAVRRALLQLGHRFLQHAFAPAADRDRGAAADEAARRAPCRVRSRRRLMRMRLPKGRRRGTGCAGRCSSRSPEWLPLPLAAVGEGEGKD